MKTCPFCAEEIRVAAVKCRHCGEFLDSHDQLELWMISPGKKKIQVIKEIRSFTQLGLREAKELVDTAPSLIATGTESELTLLAVTLGECGAQLELWASGNGNSQPAVAETTGGPSAKKPTADEGKGCALLLVVAVLLLLFGVCNSDESTEAPILDTTTTSEIPDSMTNDDSRARLAREMCDTNEGGYYHVDVECFARYMGG